MIDYVNFLPFQEYGTDEEKTTPLQNENADSYFMPLRPKEEEIEELFWLDNLLFFVYA